VIRVDAAWFAVEPLDMRAGVFPLYLIARVEIVRVASHEIRGDQGILIGRRQLVAGKLFLDELVVGLVLVASGSAPGNVQFSLLQER
jgi:hypothetical protein